MYDSLSTYTIIAQPCKIELPSFYIFIDIPTSECPKALIIIHDYLILLVCWATTLQHKVKI